MRFATIFLSIMLYGFCAFSQKYDWHMNAQVIKGFVLRHNDHVGHLANTNPSGFELNLQQELNGSRYWENLYNNPIINYGLSYYDLHSEKLGKLIIAGAAMDLPLQRKKYTALFFRIGTGLVYSTNPYNRETNNQNNMVTSTISYLIQTRFTYEIKISENFKLTPNLNVTHASNGAQQAPNRGINIVTANIGLSYRIMQAEADIEKMEVNAEEIVPYHLYLLVSGGRNTKTLQVREPLPFFNINVTAQKYLNAKSDLQLGLEYFHSNSLREQIKTNWFFDEEQRKLDFRRIGLFIGHDLKFGKLSFITQMGAYLYNPSKIRMPVYQRYGLKYQFQQHLITQVSLKVHAATAEQAELGIGWRF